MVAKQESASRTSCVFQKTDLRLLHHDTIPFATLVTAEKDNVVNAINISYREQTPKAVNDEKHSSE